MKDNTYYYTKNFGRNNEINNIDFLDIFQPTVDKNKLKKINLKIKKLNDSLKKEYSKKLDLINKIQSKCSHEYCLEEETYYEDEYGSNHRGEDVRCCASCYLYEDSRNYNLLKNSKSIPLYKFVDDKIFLLEIKDLLEYKNKNE